MSGRGYSSMPVGGYRGMSLRHLPTGFIRGWLSVAANAPHGRPSPLTREQLSRLDRSLQLELERRRKEEDR